MKKKIIGFLTVIPLANFDVSELANGIYNPSSKNSNIKLLKFIIQH